jgi:hypothetical protein
MKPKEAQDYKNSTGKDVYYRGIKVTYINDLENRLGHYELLLQDGGYLYLKPDEDLITN